MKSFKIRWQDLFTQFFLLLGSLLIIIPFLIVILGSLKNTKEAALFDLSLPGNWMIGNYLHVFQAGNLGSALKNSLILCIFSVVICIVSAALCSFILARKKSRYLFILDAVCLFGMMIPLQVITTYGLLKVLHLFGTYAGVILIETAIQLPWSIFLFAGFMRGIPIEMDEAAFIDGSGPLRMFFVIIVPLLKPVIATNVVLVAMFSWNEFMIPLYFFNTSQKWTMPLSIYNFFGQYFSDWQYVFACLVMTALPVIILYLYLQKYIIEGMTAGAVKG